MNDTSYAVRILVDQLTKHGRDSETGYGIYVGAYVTHEEEYEYKEIDLVAGLVTVGSMTFPLNMFVEALA